MKKLLVTLSIIICCTQLQAQKNFEGIITYQLHSTAEDKPDAELQLFFGFKKIKARFKEKEDYEKVELVINLDSGKTYNVNFEAKSYRSSPLILSAPRETPLKKRFAGYSASPLQQEISGLSGFLGSMLGSSNAVFYLADSLYYYVPAAFDGNKELIMIQKNRIVLGAEIQLINSFSEMEDSSSKKNPTIITVNAIDIKPMVVDAREFLVPSDFTDNKYGFDLVVPDTTAPYADSTAVAVDTMAVAPKRGAQKRTGKRATPKSKTGSKAIRRKEN